MTLLMQKVDAGFAYYFIPITLSDWKVSPTDSHLKEAPTNQVMRDLSRYLSAMLTSKESRDVTRAVTAKQPN